MVFLWFSYGFPMVFPSRTGAPRPFAGFHPTSNVQHPWDLRLFPGLMAASIWITSLGSTGREGMWGLGIWDQKTVGWVWWIYGEFMVSLWWVFGVFMVSLWWVYGEFMVSLWWVYGAENTNVWEGDCRWWWKGLQASRILDGKCAKHQEEI